MHYEKRVATIDWRKSLTMVEAMETAEIERRCAQIDAERRELTRKLFLIRNRATKRTIHAAKRASGAELRGLPCGVPQ